MQFQRRAPRHRTVHPIPHLPALIEPIGVHRFQQHLQRRQLSQRPAATLAPTQVLESL